MARLTIIEKLRAGHVRRWHIVAVAREQTLADHMYRVQLLTEEILKVIGLFDWNSSLTLNAMEWARTHDLPEVATGDIPTCGKALLDQHELHHAEASVDEDWAALAACVGADPLEPGDCTLAGLIVKLADLVEAADYCHQFGVGSHARSVGYTLNTQALAAVDPILAHPYFRSFTSSDAGSDLSRWVNRIYTGNAT